MPSAPVERQRPWPRGAGLSDDEQQIIDGKGKPFPYEGYGNLYIAQAEQWKARCRASIAGSFVAGATEDEFSLTWVDFNRRASDWSTLKLGHALVREGLRIIENAAREEGRDA